MNYHEIIDWLLSGDVSIQYQTKRDLLEGSQNELCDLQSRISKEGWGKSVAQTEADSRWNTLRALRVLRKYRRNF